MRTKITVMLLLLFVAMKAQKLKNISLSELNITNIYFPENVKDVDIGFPDDFDYSYNANILKITPLEPFDYTTNLTITTDNGIYGFNIKYKENPDSLYIPIAPNEKVITFENKINSTTKKDSIKQVKTVIPDNIVQNILNRKDERFLQYTQDQKLYFILKSAYVKDDKFYFKFSIDNQSTIDYDIDYIVAKNKSTKSKIKRTAYEEYDIKSEIYPNITQVKMNETKSFVMEISKFTLEKHSKIVFEIHEKEGGRDGIFDFKNSDFKQIKDI